MLEHTFALNNRIDGSILLTDEEAMQLHDKGFRFSIFRPGREQSFLSLPHETLINHLKGTVTFRQPEVDGVLTIRKSEQIIRMRAEG